MWPVDYASRSPPACRPSARGNGDHAVHGRGPDVLPLLQALGIKRHAHAVMPDHLSKVATTTSENVEVARERIAAETLLHLQGQAAHAAPHVRMPRCDPYPNAGGDWYHGLTDRSTADTSLGDAPAGMRTIARSNSTVIAVPMVGAGSGCTCTSAKP
jgi:hypothetical protein